MTPSFFIAAMFAGDSLHALRLLSKAQICDETFGCRQAGTG